MSNTLDRRVPIDWSHVTRFPLRLGVTSFTTPDVVEHLLDLPRQYRDEYDQGTEGACVGYSQSWLMSILNRRLYDAFRLYAAAQGIDEYADTPPAGGTSLRAGFDVLRTIGHWRIYAGATRAPMLDDGITENRWTTSVDEVRACIKVGMPVNLGVNWYTQFSTPADRSRAGDKPVSKRRDYWIGQASVNWGRVEGGHAITVVAASDRREAFGLCNTWGASYPFIVWLPYAAFIRLMNEQGEAGIITDANPK